MVSTNSLLIEVYKHYPISSNNYVQLDINPGKQDNFPERKYLRSYRSSYHTSTRESIDWFV